MKKALVSIIVIMGILFSSILAFADGENQDLLRTYNIIDDHSFQNSYVTRCEATKAIMRIVGANDCLSSIYLSKHYYMLPYKDIFGVGDPDLGYMVAAQLYGEDGYAHPYREITLREILAIMVRNLQEEYSNLEDSFAYALDINLIRKDDAFFSTDYVKYLKAEEVEILLNRFLMQKRYVYIEETKYKSEFVQKKDESGLLTYAQWQEELITLRNKVYETACVENGYPENGLVYDFGEVFSIEPSTINIKEESAQYSYLLPDDQNIIDEKLYSYTELLEGRGFQSLDDMLPDGMEGVHFFSDMNRKDENVMITVENNMITVEFYRALYSLPSDASI